MKMIKGMEEFFLCTFLSYNKLILLIEHVMRAVANLCEKVVVMHHGEMITEGTPQEVMNDPYVIEIYLGKEEESDG